MLKLKCQNRAVVLLEAEERWASVARTGMCPECSWFYDPAKELEAQRIANDPKIIAEASRVRTNGLVVGTLATAGALAGIGITVLTFQATGTLYLVFALGFALIYGLRRLLHGLLYRPVREARATIARPTDLSQLAKQQESAGVFDGSTTS